MQSCSELNARFILILIKYLSEDLKNIRNSANYRVCHHLRNVKGCGFSIRQQALGNRVPYRSLLILYIEVKSVRPAGPRCHAHLASLPLLLPLAQTPANKQEVAQRSERCIFTQDCAATFYYYLIQEVLSELSLQSREEGMKE